MYQKVLKDKEVVYIYEKEVGSLKKYTLHSPSEVRRVFIWLKKEITRETATQMLIENYNLSKMGL